MGAPKQKWTSEEEDALRAGVDKHGAGKWRTIQKDPEFCHCLATRSNIDLKDKWRNMIVSATGQGVREKSRTPKSKDQSTTQSSSQSPRVQAPANVEKQPTVESTKAPHDAKIPSRSFAQCSKWSASRSALCAMASKGPLRSDAPFAVNKYRYNAIIMEALTVLHEPNGSEIGAICKYIEQRMEIPSGFRRLLGSKLRRLVAQNKIEKGPKGYQLKEPSFATKTPTQKQKEPANRPKPPQASGFTKPIDLVEEAAISAAYKIADAEAKAFLASEAVKEAEKISKMAEETDSLLMLAKEIFERCVRGEIVTMA
ncbi:hypothetical protein M5K25_022525 [Dendrobium thyrsiflorum]|uniref:MYB transcription factor n=1 Tax=Dendrobium thyrsiflorum TaxID=117978 RepID=A0ABD0U696_DENTH